MTLRRAFSRSLLVAVLACATWPIAGCGADVPLDKSVELVVNETGYTDLGIVNGETRLVPTATLQVKNIGASAMAGFQISATFWPAGRDGATDEVILQGLVAKSLAPAALSDPIVLRANFGFKLEGARADFFAHSGFADFTIKVLGKVNGRMYRLGDVKVDRKILAKTGSMPIK